MKIFRFLILLAVLFSANVSAETAETYLSAKFTITSIKYRTSDSGGLTRYSDCEDCMLIEGSSSVGCGSGFVIRGATSGDEQAKFLKSMIMLAYTTGKQVQIGRQNCMKWNGDWKGHVNRVYLY